MAGTEAFRRTNAPLWSDLLVSDMYLGAALIGPDMGIGDNLGAAEQAADPAREVREYIADVLDRVIARQGIIRCADNSGKEFLRLAARLADHGAFLDYLDASIDGEPVVQVMTGSEYAASDPLVGWLTDEEGLEDQDDGRRYVVAGAFARAMAVQAGYAAHFGAKHIVLLARDELDHPDRKEDELGYTAGDLMSAIQKVISHSLWQVSVPAALWRQGVNRALVLRLASVGYFAIEHVRTNMDRFVMHVHAWVNRILADAAAFEDGVRGARLYRGVVRETIGDYFEFLKFDEYAQRRFDLDSMYAYSSDHERVNTKTVAAEIYNELAALRQMTLNHSHAVTHAIGWLRERRGGDGRSAYDLRDRRIAEAYKLKELAWNNFRIFNFYDAERYMNRSAQILAEKMQAVGAF
jgi:hypothetical protein